MKKINENTKVTLTLKQLKKLVKESMEDDDGMYDVTDLQSRIEDEIRREAGVQDVTCKISFDRVKFWLDIRARGGVDATMVRVAKAVRNSETIKNEVEPKIPNKKYNWEFNVISRGGNGTIYYGSDLDFYDIEVED